jgi:ornithine decarboxylase
LQPPTLPIPFAKLLKIVAIVDAANPQTKELLERIAEERYEIEVTDRFERDVSEDAAVGAYIAWIDGERREKGRELARQVRAAGFHTPLWALADSHKISDIGAFDMAGEIQGFIYLGQQTPGYYAKQVIASLIEYGTSLLPPFFGGLMAYDEEARRFTSAIRAVSSTASRPRASSSSQFGEDLPTTCATPTSISATC